jgi:hypothetical protein
MEESRVIMMITYKEDEEIVKVNLHRLRKRIGG